MNELVAADLEDALPDLDQNMMALATRPDIPAAISTPLYVLGRMPQPIAVFVWEPGS